MRLEIYPYKFLFFGLTVILILNLKIIYNLTICRFSKIYFVEIIGRSISTGTRRTYFALRL